MERLTLEPDVSARLVLDIAIIVVFIALSLGLGAATLRRRTV
jgi:hypothetical protein